MYTLYQPFRLWIILSIFAKRASRCRREEVTLLRAAFAMDVTRFSVKDFFSWPGPAKCFYCFGESELTSWFFNARPNRSLQIASA